MAPHTNLTTYLARLSGRDDACVGERPSILGWLMMDAPLPSLQELGMAPAGSSLYEGAKERGEILSDGDSLICQVRLESIAPRSISAAGPYLDGFRGRRRARTIDHILVDN